MCTSVTFATADLRHAHSKLGFQPLHMLVYYPTSLHQNYLHLEGEQVQVSTSFGPSYLSDMAGRLPCLDVEVLFAESSSRSFDLLIPERVSIVVDCRLTTS